MNKTPSRIVADHIRAKVLNVAQDADEMHGPDYPDYIELMDGLAAEFKSRADTARENYGPQAVLRAVRNWLETCRPAYTAEMWDTGGGCKAIGVQPVGADWHWLITGAEGAQAPDTEDEPVALGLYVGDWWVCFDCDNLAGALRIIRAFVSHSGP